MFICRYSTLPIWSSDLENDSDSSLNIWLATCFWHSFRWVINRRIPLFISNCIIAWVFSLHFVDCCSRKAVWLQYVSRLHCPYRPHSFNSNPSWQCIVVASRVLYTDNFWGHASLHWYNNVTKLKSFRPLWILIRFKYHSLVFPEGWSLHSTFDLDGAVFRHVNSLIGCFHIVLTGLTSTRCINKGFCFIIILQVRENYFTVLRVFLCLLSDPVHCSPLSAQWH